MKASHRRLAAAGLSALCSLWHLPASAETLAEAIGFAYASHPELVAGRAEVRALDEGYVQARGGMGPRVELSGGQRYTYSRTDTTTRGLSENEGATSDAALTMAQPLLTFGRVSADVDRAYANVEAGREVLRQTDTDVLREVIVAYVSVLHGQRAMTLANENLALLLQQLNDTQARYDAREATATDRAQAQSRHAAALSDLASARGDLEASRAVYLAVVGHNPGELAPEPPLGALPGTIEEAVAIAIENNPSVDAARFREESARAARAAAQAEFLPDVSLRVDAGDAPIGAFRNTPREADLTARVVVRQTLYASGVNSSRAREAVQRSAQARAETDAARRVATQRIGQAWAQLASLRVAVARNTERVGVLRVAMEGARLEESMGVRTTLDVLNQAQELQSAQLALLQSQTNSYIATVNLLAQMGVLTVERLAPGVSSYDPRKPFEKVRRRSGAPWSGALLKLDEAMQSRQGMQFQPDPAVGAVPDVSPTLPLP